jgi:hypothetical protein
VGAGCWHNSQLAGPRCCSEKSTGRHFAVAVAVAVASRSGRSGVWCLAASLFPLRSCLVGGGVEGATCSQASRSLARARAGPAGPARESSRCLIRRGTSESAGPASTTGALPLATRLPRASKISTCLAVSGECE